MFPTQNPTEGYQTQDFIRGKAFLTSWFGGLTSLYILFMAGLTRSQTTNFRLFQTERICRRQLSIDENGRNFSKRIENTAGKGKIARYKQFFLFPQCFQKTCTADM